MNSDSPSSKEVWQFGEGDIIREQFSITPPGATSVRKSELRIKRLLRDESDGHRFYDVEKETGGSMMYSAGTLEGSWETISADESEAFGYE